MGHIFLKIFKMQFVFTIDRKSRQQNKKMEKSSKPRINVEKKRNNNFKFYNLNAYLMTYSDTNSKH